MFRININEDIAPTPLHDNHVCACSGKNLRTAYFVKFYLEKKKCIIIIIYEVSEKKRVTLLNYVRRVSA